MTSSWQDSCGRAEHRARIAERALELLRTTTLGTRTIALSLTKETERPILRRGLSTWTGMNPAIDAAIAEAEEEGWEVDHYVEVEE